MIIIAVVLVFFIIAAVRKGHRKAIRDVAIAKPFPEEWDAVLRKNLPPYEKLPDDLREDLQRNIKVFLVEKTFEGCAELEVTDEIRVTVAAQACLLLLNRPARIYPKLDTILIYPSTYVAGGKGLFADKSEKPSARLGESWQNGSVVLAWSSVKQGAFNFEDGHNVVMHEFAHQLDQEDGNADGAPILERRSAYSSWAKVLSEEYADLQGKTKKHKRHIMDSYGATNPAEFFAVATETFFEKPMQMQKTHPELYEELEGFYKVDPIKWT